ncbi:MAG: FAD:protein FMN transferase [Candidatus Hydrothermia bacterium]
MKRLISFIVLFILLCFGCGKKTSYVTKTYTVMGTVLNVTLPEKDIFYADSVFYIFKLIDSLMNPIKEGSDIFKINHSDTFVEVHPFTYECIEKSLEVARVTEGAFDITVGVLVHLWHFDEYGKYVFPDEDSIEKYRRFVNWREITLRNGKIKLAKNQQITVAGIAKGYAIERAADFLKNKGVSSGIIDAGGDLYLIGKKWGESWKVGVRDPFTKGINRILALSDVSCCTSGDYERYVEQNGKRYSHIFSPFDGYPVSNGVRSVTVIYKDATYADAFATALFVMGPDKAPELREKVKGLEYMIITDDTTFYSEGFSKYLVP